MAETEEKGTQDIGDGKDDGQRGGAGGDAGTTTPALGVVAQERDLAQDRAAIERQVRLDMILREKPPTLRVRAIGLVETAAGFVVQGGVSVDLPTDEAMRLREAGSVRLEDPDLEAYAAENIARRAETGGEG